MLLKREEGEAAGRVGDTRSVQGASPSLIYFSYNRNKNKMQFDHKP